MSTIRTTHPEGGFSAVELLITLGIGAMFVISFYQIYIVVVQGNATARFQAVAGDIAYSNLRKYTTRPSFTCNTNTDLTANVNAPGEVIFQTTSATHPQLPGPVVQTVKVFAPRGCDAAYPVKIESDATYGSPAKKVIHSTYVN